MGCQKITSIKVVASAEREGAGGGEKDRKSMVAGGGVWTLRKVKKGEVTARRGVSPLYE